MVKFLRIDEIQRFVYGIILFLWLLLAYSEIEDWWKQSDIYVQVFYLFLIPTIFLFIQLFFNSKLGWILIFINCLLYILLSLILFIENEYRISKYDIDYLSTDYFDIVPYFGVLFSVLFILFLIRPIKVK